MVRSFPRLLSLFLVLFSTALFAQGTTGSLSGTVTTDGAPLPGVSVTITSPSLQGTRTAITNDNGQYLFPALPPGEYTVTAALSGLQTVQRTTVVSLAQTSRVDVAMRVTALAEAITVTAEAPAVLETTGMAANYTSTQVDELPMGRTLGATALLSPGVTNASTGNANQYQISGAPGYDNLILVNGVVVNENLRAQVHNLFIEDAIQETTVLSGGVSAEFGRFTGGVVSAITKSGGNEFSGSFRDSLTNPKWEKKTPWPGQPDNVDELSEVYEATLGGYILRDRLWFFAAGRDVESSVQRFTSIQNFPYVFSAEETRWEGKLTGKITDNHNLVGSYFEVDRVEANSSFGTIYDQRSLYNRELPNTLLTANYSGILTPNLLLEASYSEKDFAFVGSGAPTRDRVEGTLLVDTSNGSRRYWSPTFCGVCTDEERNNDSQLLKATYYLGTPSLGTHSIVFGVENFAETRLVNNHQSGSDFRILSGTVRDGGAVLFGAHGGPFPIFTEGTIIQWNPILFPSPGSDLATQSAFVNDKWDLNDNFSFNIGLRYDKNDATDSFGNVVSDDSAFSPRLGMTYDIAGDGRNRITATWSRYVSKIMDGNVGGAASPAGNPAAITFFYRGPGINTSGTPIPPDQALSAMWAAFDAAFPGLTTSNYLDHPWFRSASIPGVSTLFVDTITSPSMDEFTIGYGTALGRTGFVRGDIIVREWNDFYQNYLTLETGKTPDSRGDVSNMRNTNELEREYQGLHIQAGWRPSRFNVGGSYTLASLEGNDESEGTATATSPNATLQGWYPEYLGYAQRMPVGSLDGDNRHRLKAWAGYDIPTPEWLGRFNVSALHTYESGTAYGAVGTIDASGRTTPFAGSPTNPGYTLSRLGDQHTYWFTDRDAFRTPDFHRTDLSVNYSLPLWRVQLFAQAEMFNIFNNDEVTNPNTTIVTRRSGGANSGLVAFNPFTDTPVEGTHWRKGTNFGQPTGPTSYQNPRFYQFSVGLRF
jgi:hypothetical protein